MRDKEPDGQKFTIEPAVRICQQENAPLMYAASATAEELLKWCGVPRTIKNYKADYQRVLEEDRSKRIKDYLQQSEKNLIPGAVIIAVDRKHFKEQEITIGESGSVFRLTITMDAEEKNEKKKRETRLSKHLANLTSRLSDEEIESVGLSGHEPQSNAICEGDGDDADEEDNDEGNDQIGELPSHLASIAKEVENASRDWKKIEPDRRKAIEEYLENSRKPGLIIDGQHRVYGAYEADGSEVNLPVILMPGLDHAEQVFHFHVLNSTAKPLKPMQLRKIISTSLTRKEIEKLDTRFRQAGLKTNEAQWTYKMNASAESPFFGLIDFKDIERDAAGNIVRHGEIIDENVAFQVVRTFMRLPKNKYGNLFEGVGEWTDDKYRMSLFFAFWTAISECYEDVWTEAKEQGKTGRLEQIFYKVALVNLQKFALKEINRSYLDRSARGEKPKRAFSSKEVLQREVCFALSNLPAKFFSDPWKVTQLDTAHGNAMLLQAMDNAVQKSGVVDTNNPPFGP